MSFVSILSCLLDHFVGTLCADKNCLTVEPLIPKLIVSVLFTFNRDTATPTMFPRLS